MKRKSLLFLLLMAVFAPWAAMAQSEVVVFGDDATGTTNYVSPYGGWYGYQYTVLLYTPDELGDFEGTISAVAFKRPSSSSASESANFTLWMKDVPSNYTLSTATTFGEYTEGLTPVYTSEGMPAFETGWNTTTLTNEFEHEAGNAILVMSRAVGCSSSGGCPKNVYYVTKSNQSWYYLKDSNDPGTNVAGNMNQTQLPSIKFFYEEPQGSCPKPKTLVASDVTAHGVTLTWTMDEPLSSDAPGFNLEYKKASDPDDAWNRIGLGNDVNTYTITSGLDAETEYQARVQAVCGIDDNNSDWRNAQNFTTTVACPAPTNLAMTGITAYEATATWEGTSDSYVVSLGVYDYTAQPTTETLIEEGFEDAESFGDWTPISGNVTRKSGYPHTGSYYLDFRGTTSNMIALPKLNVPTNTLNVEFWTRPESTYGNSGKFAIGYMTDIADASTFVAVETYNSTEMTSTYVKKTVDFSNAPDNAYIAFRQFDCSTYYYWYVDDVVVTGPVYPINWTEYSTSNQTYTFENLTPNTLYQVKVKGNCGSEGESVYSDVINFTTLVSCTAPTGLAIANGYPTAHGVSFTWDYAAGEVYQFALPIDNVTDPEQVTWNTTWYAGEEFPVWDNLTAETTRTFWLRKKCSDTDFSEPVYMTFTTPEACPAPTGFAVMPNSITGHTANLTWQGTSNSYQVAYRTTAYVDGTEEDFSSNPSDWTFTTGALNSDGTATLSGTSSWTRGTNCGVFDTHIYMNMYSTKNYWLITPSMDINDGDALSFDIAYTAYSSGTTNAAPALNCTTHRFVVLISTDNKEHWTILREWNNAGTGTDVLDNVSQTGQTVSGIDLSAYAGEGRYIAFFGHSETTSYDNNFHFDNVTIGTPVPAGEMQYETNIEAETVTLQGLAAETLYEAWLLGDCGDEGFSTEVGPITFTTDVACPAPTGFALETLKSDHVVLNWNAGADAWQIQINDNTVYTDVALADVTINEGVVTYTLDGLTENTAYTLKLRANCGDEGYSQWTSPLSFTTLEACPQPTAVNVSNIEHYSATVNWTGNSESFTVKYRTAGHHEFIDADFENGSLPTGWTNEGETDKASWTVGTGDYNTSTGAHNSNYNALISYMNHGAETYLVTPAMDLSGKSGLNLGLYYINRDWSGDTDGFGIYYRIDGGEWIEIFATAEDHGSWTAYDEPLPAGAYAANCQIGFKFDGDYGYGVGLDDITLGEMVGVGTWIEVPANDSPANLSNLTLDTKYEVVVVPSCSEESASEPVFFTTRSANDKIFAVEGNWNEASNWIPEGVPTIDQTVELRANATITGEAFAKSITGTGTAANNFTLTIENGGKLKHLNSNVRATVKKTIDGYENYTGEYNGGYYLITNPLTSGYTPNAEGTDGILVGNYDLYNWNYQASDGNEWVNFKNPNNYFTSLNSGAYGYLYANETGTELIYNGTINAYTSYKYRSASVPTSPDSYDFPGWYLLGNPYMYDAYLTGASTNGTALPYVKMNADGDGFENVAAGTPIAPMEGFFYQGATDATSAYVVTYEPTVPNEGKLNMNLRKGNKQLDNAILVFGGEQQLSKMSFREGSSKIYMPVEGKDLAIVSTESNVGEMPVSFKAEKNGTYSLSFTSQEVSFSYLHLIDNMTGNDVDLLQNPSYTFDATTTDYASRFRLVFATGNNSNEDSFAYFNNGSFVINNEGEATLQVVDVMGRIIKSESINGCANVNVNAAPGVYMLRLMNGNDVKVQKVVVK